MTCINLPACDFQSSLIAMIVPDPDTFVTYAKDKMGLTGTMEELCQKPVRYLMYNLLNKILDLLQNM